MLGAPGFTPGGLHSWTVIDSWRNPRQAYATFGSLSFAAPADLAMCKRQRHQLRTGLVQVPQDHAGESAAHGEQGTREPGPLDRSRLQQLQLLEILRLVYLEGRYRASAIGAGRHAGVSDKSVLARHIANLLRSVVVRRALFVNTQLEQRLQEPFLGFVEVYSNFHSRTFGSYPGFL